MADLMEDYDNNDNQNNQNVNTLDEDGIYVTTPVPNKFAKYNANRKFRPQWSEKYFWLENRNGRAFCSACEKFIINNLTHISKHGQNMSHRKIIKDQMNRLRVERLEEVNSHNGEHDEIKIERLSDDERRQLKMVLTKRSSKNNVTNNKLSRQAVDTICTNEQKECDKVVEVWAMKLQKMDPTQQIIAERFINEILFEGQMGTLHRNAMQLHIVERIYDPDNIQNDE